MDNLPSSQGHPPLKWVLSLITIYHSLCEKFKQKIFRQLLSAPGRLNLFSSPASLVSFSRYRWEQVSNVVFTDSYPKCSENSKMSKPISISILACDSLSKRYYRTGQQIHCKIGTSINIPKNKIKLLYITAHECITNNCIRVHTCKKRTRYFYTLSGSFCVPKYIRKNRYLHPCTIMLRITSYSLHYFIKQFHLFIC